VRPEVREVTSTTEMTGERIATRERMAGHHTAHMAAEAAAVAATPSTSAGERGWRERGT
jgi:hypothetical protein